MAEKLDFVDTGKAVGHHQRTDTIVARGKCTFCKSKASFRQLAKVRDSKIIGKNIPVICEGCQTFALVSISDARLLPSDDKGLDDLPSQIAAPYNEAITCMEAGAEHAACTMWRKVVQAVCVYYNVADIDDNAQIYSMIEDLAEEGHITDKHREGLLAVKDIGNDGAHVNENKPDQKQAQILRDIVGSLLNATVVAEQYIEEARDIRPNEYAE